MCTVSWTACRGGYDLFFNRDELTTRAPENPPYVAQYTDVAYLAPRDGDHGGTWLLVNHHGLTICLLNDYGLNWRPVASAPLFSRGRVVLACAALVSPSDAAGVVGSLPLARTPAFHLVILAPEEEASVLHWDGAKLSRDHQHINLPLLSSSSFETTAVVATRKTKFDSFVQSRDRIKVRELAAYHRQHDLSCGSYSVLMRRANAATRSITHITVRNRTVAMNYKPLSWTPLGPVVSATKILTLPRQRGATCMGLSL
jgi:hypothetical protein